MSTCLLQPILHNVEPVIHADVLTGSTELLWPWIHLDKLIKGGCGQDTWEPAENLQNCEETLAKYWRSLAQKQSAHEKVSWGSKR